MHGCDTSMVVTVRDMQYTPHPNKIQPDGSAVWSGDLGPNIDDTVYVVTNTEFFSFQYTFEIEETNPKCRWESCTWDINKLSWSYNYNTDLEIGISKCTVYIAEHDDDYVILTATVKNGCPSSNDSIQSKIFLKSSFLDIDEQNATQSDFSVVPNPNNGQMKLVFNRFGGKVDVKVYDVTGNLIDSFATYNDADTNSFEYDMNCPKGLYFIVANGKEGTNAKKVVIR
jgi:hypothetical protein